MFLRSTILILNVGVSNRFRLAGAPAPDSGQDKSLQKNAKRITQKRFSVSKEASGTTRLGSHRHYSPENA